MKRVSSHLGYLDQYLAGSEPPPPARSPTPPIIVPVRAVWSPVKGNTRADARTAPTLRHGCASAAKHRTHVPKKKSPCAGASMAVAMQALDEGSFMCRDASRTSSRRSRSSSRGRRAVSVSSPTSEEIANVRRRDSERAAAAARRARAGADVQACCLSAAHSAAGLLSRVKMPAAESQCQHITGAVECLRHHSAESRRFGCDPLPHVLSTVSKAATPN